MYFLLLLFLFYDKQEMKNLFSLIIRVNHKWLVKLMNFYIIMHHKNAEKVEFVLLM